MVRDQGTKTIQDLGYRVHEVLTSGFYDFPPASHLLRELGFEFIQKPFTPTELADKVKSIRSQFFDKGILTSRSPEHIEGKNLVSTNLEGVVGMLPRGYSATPHLIFHLPDWVRLSARILFKSFL